MNDLINQKLQEICFALLRVAAHIRRSEMRKNLERLTYHLLENVSYKNTELAINTVNAIRNFVVFGKNLYEIEPVNAKILERELGSLAREIKISGGISSIEDLESYFTKQVSLKRDSHPTNEVSFPAASSKSKTSESAETDLIPEEVIIDDFEINYGEAEYGNTAIGNQAIYNTATGLGNTAKDSNEDVGAAMRKDKIFVMISTAPEKRLALKEVVAAFPSVSERTLRYDLKKLSAEGRIERQGSGGPSSYYTVKTSSNGLNLPSVINL